MALPSGLFVPWITAEAAVSLCAAEAAQEDRSFPGALSLGEGVRRREVGENSRAELVSLAAVGAHEASSCCENDQLSMGGSLHPGQMVCEPGAVTHTAFVHAS